MGLLRGFTAVVLSAALVTPVSALAQEPQSGTAASTPRPESAKSTDANLPVSLDRIRRQLNATKPRTRGAKDGLRLEYFVDVYGRAPRIELFLPTENVTSAPVMYGGMTHQEFLQVVTPEEFKSPPADIGSAVAALIKWLSDKQKNGQDPRK